MVSTETLEWRVNAYWEERRKNTMWVIELGKVARSRAKFSAAKERYGLCHEVTMNTRTVNDY